MKQENVNIRTIENEPSSYFYYLEYNDHNLSRLDKFIFKSRNDAYQQATFHIFQYLISQKKLSSEQELNILKNRINTFNTKLIKKQYIEIVKCFYKYKVPLMQFKVSKIKNLVSIPEEIPCLL